MAAPKISVIIPTYNRLELVREGLESLAQQRAPATDFEVIVSDDGSSDGTKDVVGSFSGRLDVRYLFQEDEGFRVAAARNAGARAARAPVLAFCDAGTVPGPDFVTGHLRAHAEALGPAAVIGYCYGYQPFDDLQWHTAELRAHGPAEVLRRHSDDPSFLDARHAEFAKVDFDCGRMAAPWFLCWSMNFSVRADTFWKAGGFDEAYRSWGGEDTELGFRLFRGGATFSLSRQAWTIELPHERRNKGNRQSMLRNARYFVKKHPEPIAELYRDALAYPDLGLMESGTAALNAWTAQAAALDVLPELRRACEDIAADAGVAIIGCGGLVPRSLQPATLLDFDQRLLARALESSPHTGHHALGLRTPLRSSAFDVVIITSRLAGLWDRWGKDVLSEAHRIGATVRGPLTPLTPASLS
jgi:glycosyltransferase involved in cell wall biosynthesis